MSHLQSFTYGLGLSAFATVVSSAVALWGFRRVYYLAQMLPVFMAFWVLLAWLVHLKRTSFHALNPRTVSNPGSDLPETKVSGEELLGSRDESGLVPRRPTLEDNRVEAFLRNPVPALLWSAFQLAVLSTVLYSALGIGASYH